MSNDLPPRGGAVETPHDLVSDFIAQRKDWIAMFNRSVRPALFAGLGTSFILLGLMMASAFGVALWRAALALPVGDMTVGIGPLLVTAVPLLLAQSHRFQEKRAGVVG